MEDKSRREQIIEVVNKLFVYTDNRDWDKLIQEVFSDFVTFDMSSAGGAPAAKVHPSEICKAWDQGFNGIDAVHHQSGNFIVTLGEGSADVFCYALATHYKKSATKGNFREFTGSYEFILVLTDLGWRISAFKYNLKYISGNQSLE